MRQLLTDHGFTIANLNYRLDVNLDFFEYEMVIRTNRPENVSKLTEALKKINSLKEFRVWPTGD
jgi:putative Mg2+ transporter-C (MgtC) family protein